MADRIRLQIIKKPPLSPARCDYRKGFVYMAEPREAEWLQEGGYACAEDEVEAFALAELAAKQAAADEIVAAREARCAANKAADCADRLARSEANASRARARSAEILAARASGHVRKAPEQTTGEVIANG